MKHSINFTVLIPARLQSTRLPRKVLANIAGIPMLVRVAQQAIKSNACQVMIATDSQEIAKICEEFKLSVIMTKSSHKSGTERLAEAIQNLNLSAQEIIVNVQGDEPLINPLLINQLAEHLYHCRSPVATLAHVIHEEETLNNPNVVKVVLNKNKEALYFSRSIIPYHRNHHQLPLLRHIGLYAYRADFLKIYQNLSCSLLEQVESLEQLRILWHGFPISVLVTEEETGMGVDTAEDLQKIVELINSKDLK